jgi:hypothetical protein
MNTCNTQIYTQTPTCRSKPRIHQPNESAGRRRARCPSFSRRRRTHVSAAPVPKRWRTRRPLASLGVESLLLPRWSATLSIALLHSTNYI